MVAVGAKGRPIRVETVGSDLHIFAPDGTLRWAGRPLGYPVAWAQADPTGAAAIVLLDYMLGPKNFANILAVRDDGCIAWRAGPPDPTGPDAFVAAAIDDGSLTAHTWSGYLVSLDLKTGMATDRSFVK